MGGRPVDPVFVEREHRKATPADLAAYERALEILDPGACPNLGQLIGRLALGVPVQERGNGGASLRELAIARKALKAAQEEIGRRDQRIVALQSRIDRGDEKAEERMRRALDAEAEAHAETRNALSVARAEIERLNETKAKATPGCPICAAVRRAVLGASAPPKPKRPKREQHRAMSPEDAAKPAKPSAATSERVVLSALREAGGPLSLGEVAKACPDLRLLTVQCALRRLKARGIVVMTGMRSTAKYRASRVEVPA